MPKGRKPRIMDKLGDFVQPKSFEHTRKTGAGEAIQYSKEVADKIIARIMKKETIASICADPDMPCYDTFFDWCAAHDDFMSRYKSAHSLQADLYFYEIIDMAKSLQFHPDPNAKRIAIDALKYAIAKMNPQKYNDKYIVDIKQDKTVKFSWETATGNVIEHGSQDTLPSPRSIEFHS